MNYTVNYTSMNFVNAVKPNLSKSVPIMVDIAIANARFHGIQLHLGALNSASGDCAFEAVADNISKRSCFTEVYNEGPENNRQKWMTEAEPLVYNFSGGAGLSKREFMKQWNVLKEPKQYEYN